MTIDIPAFCAKFDVNPAYVVQTEGGIRLRDVPNHEADRIILALLRSGLITWFEDDVLSHEDLNGDDLDNLPHLPTTEGNA